MPEARIELLQRMPVFGGIRADILEFLLGFCPVVLVPANAFFFREHDQADFNVRPRSGQSGGAEILARAGLSPPNVEGGRLLRRIGGHGPVSAKRLSSGG